MAEVVSMYVTGLDELADYFTSLGPITRRVIASAMYQFADFIMTDAKQHYVPVEEDVLRSSGQVGKPVLDGNTVSVTMGFGGAASAYALAVHEHLSKHSPPTWKIAEAKGRGVKFRVGGPKYLERPFLEHVGGGRFEAFLAAALAKAYNESFGLGTGAYGGGPTGGGML